MTLQQLEYVVALDTYRHYVTAAEKCHVTQPTITIQVKKLEEEIGFLIFDKSVTPFRTSELGEIFIQKAKVILREAGELKHMVNSALYNMKGEFRIGVIPTISPYLIPLISGSFAAGNPETRLSIDEMQSEAIIEALQKKEIDIGILVTPIDEAYIREIKLYDEPFVFYGQKGYLNEEVRSISMRDIEEMENVWLLKNGHCFRNQVLNICNKSKENRAIKFQSGSIEVLKKMIDNYGGFTLIPQMAVDKSDPGCILPFEEPQPVREVSLVVHHSFSNNAIIDALRKEILAKIPDDFQKSKNFIKIKWR